MMAVLLLFSLVQAQNYIPILECVSHVTFTIENADRTKKVYQPGTYQMPLANVLVVSVGDTPATRISIYPQNGIHYGRIKNNFIKVRTDDNTYFETYDSRTSKKNSSLYCRIL